MAEPDPATLVELQFEQSRRFVDDWLLSTERLLANFSSIRTDPGKGVPGPCKVQLCTVNNLSFYNININNSYYNYNYYYSVYLS